MSTGVLIQRVKDRCGFSQDRFLAVTEKTGWKPELRISVLALTFYAERAFDCFS